MPGTLDLHDYFPEPKNERLRPSSVTAAGLRQRVAAEDVPARVVERAVPPLAASAGVERNLAVQRMERLGSVGQFQIKGLNRLAKQNKRARRQLRGA